MILLDTNILLYATGGDHALRDPCRSILESVGLGTVAGHITDAILAEFLYARSRRSDRPAAARLARDVAATVTSVLPVSDRARARAITLFGSTSRLSSNDALIAAVAIDEGLHLVSADRDFEEVPMLRLIPPDSGEAAGLA